MAQLNFHNNFSATKPPPKGTLPIIQRLINLYKLWHEYLPHLPKKSRYTLGGKIDLLFVELLELAFSASYVGKKEKIPYLRKAVSKLDLIKFFLQVLWELKDLDNKKYIAISELLNEIGRMLGGWLRKIEKETPAEAGERK